MTTKLPNGRWLILFFLPALLAAGISLPTFKITDRVSPEMIYRCFIGAGGYLFALSFVYCKKNHQRGLELTLRSLVMMLCLITANVLFYGIIYFAGCACVWSGVRN